MVRKNNRLSLLFQEKTLKAFFPNSYIKRFRESEITWIGKLTPSPLSNTYKIRLHYKRNKGVKVYVKDPYPLKLAKGLTKLPHVYSTKEQRLCLYYPKNKEWDVSQHYVNSIIPWTSEWLLHYELWLATGKWHGGGIDHGPEEIKTSNTTEKQPV